MSTSTRLHLKVVPKASCNGLVGWVGDSLKIRVTAAPERGKANAAVIELLAAALGVKRDSLHLIAGSAKEHKIVAVQGISEMEARARLERTLRKGI